MPRELDRLHEFDSHVAATASLAGSVLQGLDLRERSTILRHLDVEGSVFLGCDLALGDADILLEGGASIHPALSGIPFRTYRTRLYSADELFDGYVLGDDATFGSSFDSRVYRWHKKNNGLVQCLAKRLHDAGIDDALAELLEEHGTKGVVALMGGHALARTDARYRDAACIGRALSRHGCLMASGGGPGAMEATNLGAWLAPYEDAALDEAIEMLAAAPVFEPVERWIETAMRVRQRFPDGGTNLGVPTWHYGHEPPNVFASHVAKYFDNSIREDGLLAIAGSGVVYVPGSAGTIQEIFQEAAQNHYESWGPAAPMVFLDIEYWTHTKPVYPVLAQLAEGHRYGELLGIYDTAEDVIAHLIG
jgi:predicted Rossmann-fold nucleotide-binding protein